MAAAAAEALVLGAGQHRALTAVANSRTAAHREVVRAKVLLAAADGMANTRIAATCGVTPVTVRAWRRAFEDNGLAGWGEVAPGRGRKPVISDETIARIVQLTTTTTPKGHTHWSCRTMAAEVGVSKDTVARVWSDLGLAPHRTDTFKVSNDPQFVDKLIDVVGIYLNPPGQAAVFCVDEKSQIQALDRTQPSLPMTKGRAGTMTHDYKRNGTTTLFAALDVLTGKVIGQCLPRHTHAEFLTFLKRINREVPRRLQVHVILDNYATHKHPAVRAWLAAHPRFHLHFTPTSSSWLNQVERWFRELTDKNIRRGTFANVPDLIAGIETFLDATNDNPKPYIWTATAEQILAKIERARAALSQVESQN